MVVLGSHAGESSLKNDIKYRLNSNKTNRKPNTTISIKYQITKPNTTISKLSRTAQINQRYKQNPEFKQLFKVQPQNNLDFIQNFLDISHDPKQIVLSKATAVPQENVTITNHKKVLKVSNFTIQQIRWLQPQT